MEINEDILARYHLGTCTAAERKAVEEWLFSAETGEVEWEVLGEEKAAVGKDMWADIETILPKPAIIKPKSNTYFMWKGAIAASLFIGCAGMIICFLLANKPAAQADFIHLNNPSAFAVKRIDSKDYDLSIGPNTVAKLNHANGLIYLKGSILISPKEEINLVFDGTNKKVTLQKGQTYIILKNATGAKSIVVITERNLINLPPVMQKQLTTQFGI